MGMLGRPGALMKELRARFSFLVPHSAVVDVLEVGSGESAYRRMRAGT